MRYVLYHSNCFDGTGSGFSAWKFFGDIATVYREVSYGYPIPEMPDATEVLILDFSYPRKEIEALANKVPLTVLDHHKTAQQDLEPLIRTEGRPEIGKPIVIFDMTRSGAKITWEYLHQTPPPPLIEYISDRDLWQFKLPDSKLVHDALVSYPKDFRVWDSLDVEKLKVEGVTCKRLYDSLVKNICDSSWIGTLDGHKVPMVNTTIAWSEVGQELLARNPDYPFAVSFTVFQDQMMYSLRSRPDFDVSAVAKRFGGGGHKNAAGMKIKHSDNFDWNIRVEEPNGR